MIAYAELYVKKYVYILYALLCIFVYVYTLKIGRNISGYRYLYMRDYMQIIYSLCAQQKLHKSLIEDGISKYYPLF